MIWCFWQRSFMGSASVNTQKRPVVLFALSVHRDQFARVQDRLIILSLCCVAAVDWGTCGGRPSSSDRGIYGEMHTLICVTFRSRVCPRGFQRHRAIFGLPFWGGGGWMPSTGKRKDRLNVAAAPKWRYYRFAFTFIVCGLNHSHDTWLSAFEFARYSVEAAITR